MATFSQNTRHDLSLLPNAPELGDVPQAGRLMGYHRTTTPSPKAAAPSGMRRETHGRPSSEG
jgi:hypothetical protein